MKKSLLIAAILGASILPASETAIFTPYGYWPICQAQHLTSADTIMCAGFVAGKEPYMLILKASGPSTTAFRYSVSGTAADGKAMAFTGLVNRAESGNTFEVILCGALSGVVVVVDELTAISQRRERVL